VTVVEAAAIVPMAIAGDAKDPIEPATSAPLACPVLAQDAAVTDSPVSTTDLTRFASTFSALADPDVMSQAWQCPAG
jgi:hypothetical protein